MAVSICAILWCKGLRHRWEGTRNSTSVLDGWIISDHDGVRKRWAECFESLYQADTSAVTLDANGTAIPVLDHPPISKEPPTLTKVMEAISRLMGGKPWAYAVSLLNC